MMTNIVWTDDIDILLKSPRKHMADLLIDLCTMYVSVIVRLFLFFKWF